MEAQEEPTLAPTEVKMEVPEVQEVVLDSDDSSDSDDDVIPMPTPEDGDRAWPRPPNSNRLPKNLKKEPDVIDLTKEDNTEDEDMMTDADVSDPSVHIVDDDMPELIPMEPVAAQEVGEDRKKRGNDHFKVGEYYQALEMYTKAIDAMPSEASYYGNRSACYMMLKRYKEALSDIRTSLQLDPAYEKGYLRLIRTTLALGNIRECEIAFETALRMGLNVGANVEQERLVWLKSSMMEIETTKAKKDYRKLIYLTSKALDIATADNVLKMVKADALVRLGRHTEAQELCTEVLQNDVRCPEALYIRAMCLYLDDNMEKSIQFVRQGLQYAPDNSSFQTLFKKLKQIKELRDIGSTKFSSHRYQEAKDDYSQCLGIVNMGDMNNITIQSKLHFNLALIAQKLNKLDESLEACGKAIELNSKYLKAIIHRARIYNLKEMYDDAVHDFEAALRIDPTLKDLKRDLDNTKLAAKRAKRKDYYKILNVEKGATEDEIRKAYKKRALLHHPDRHANATEAVQKEQERLFKDLGEAYEVLSDSKKRFRYDQGVDLMDDGGGYHHPSYDPSTQDFLNVFFGAGGYPSFRPGQGGAGGQHHRYHHTFRH